MKMFLMLFVLATLSFGCNKEKAATRKLKGDWKVTVRATHWQNGSSTAPQSTTYSNIGTLSMDKNGEGILNDFDPQYDPITAKHFMDGDERIRLTYMDGVLHGDFYVTWGWDKKSFQMAKRNIEYPTPPQAYESYVELIYICEKK